MKDNKSQTSCKMALFQRALFSIQWFLPVKGSVMILPVMYRCYHHRAFSTIGTEETKQSELDLRATFLAKTFSTSKAKLETFLSSNVHIVAMNRNKFQNISLVLKDYGLTGEDILSYPEVYSCSISKMKSRMDELRSEGLGISLSLVTISANRFRTRIARLIIQSKLEHEFENHEVLLMKLLECSQQKARTLIKEHEWIKKSRLETLKTSIETIKRYGVSSEAIVERLFVIVVSKDTLEHQLSTLKEHGILFFEYPSVFLSFIHPQNKKFKKSLSRVLVERQILQECNCKNKEEYIYHRLGCTADEFNVMLQQNRHMMSVSLPKLKDNLDFLLNTCKMMPKDIISNALILAFANSTLCQRYKELEDLGVTVTPMHLKMSRDKYTNLLNRFSKH